MPSLFRDKQGKYRVQWVHDGRRKSRSFDCPKKAKLFEMQVELGEVDTGQGASPTFEAYAVRWMRDYCKVEKAESQWREDQSVIDMYLIPAFGSRRLDELRKAHLVEFKSAMAKLRSEKTKKPLSPKTVNNILALAKKMLNTAVDMELLEASPWIAVKPLRVSEDSFAFWTPTERDQFLRTIALVNEPFARLVCVACHTGLRLGELAGLRRKDIDFAQRMVHVRGQYSMKLAKRVDHTKGKRSESVPLNAVAISALNHCMNMAAEESVFDLGMFSNAQRQLRRYARRAKVKSIRFHDLRHTFASCLAMAGVDLMVIQKLMRHKSYQMTLRYAHLHPDHLRGATDVLANPQRTQLHADCTPESYPQGASPETLEEWWAHRDLNPGPTGYEEVA